jgi:hypothetical protein
MGRIQIWSGCGSEDPDPDIEQKILMDPEHCSAAHFFPVPGVIFLDHIKGGIVT